MTPTAWRFTLFGIFGMFGEVVFTALQGLFRTRRLRLQGFSFLWMFPIYGLLAFLFQPLAHWIAPYPTLIRGLLYMGGIYAIEFLTGSVLTRLTGGPIWHYTGRWSYKGQITLTHAPVWFLLGLIVEKYYTWMERASEALAHL